MTCRVDMSLISQMCLKSQLSGSFHQSQSLAFILGTFFTKRTCKTTKCDDERFLINMIQSRKGNLPLKADAGPVARSGLLISLLTYGLV